MAGADLGNVSFFCDICGKTFPSKKSLNPHMKLHRGERLFRCNICMKAFPKKSKLTSHMISHTGERKFKCDICMKSSGHKADLKKHMLIHTGECQFKCNICLKDFTHKKSLTTHMNTHTSEHKFSCSMCVKHFDIQSHLISHMSTHEDARKFKCNICMKRFLHKSSLNRHMTTHTGNCNFKCNICMKVFLRKSSLVRHIMTHAKETKVSPKTSESAGQITQIFIHDSSEENNEMEMESDSSVVNDDQCIPNDPLMIETGVKEIKLKSESIGENERISSDSSITDNTIEGTASNDSNLSCADNGDTVFNHLNTDQTLTDNAVTTTNIIRRDAFILATASTNCVKKEECIDYEYEEEFDYNG